MNERIRKLMLKADRETVYHTDDGSPYLVREFDVEKFAELIVQECATAIINDSRLNDVRSAANGCVRTIKEHFGVEQ